MAKMRFVLACLAAVAFAVSASAKELQLIGNPVKVMPEKAMKVQFNADGTVTPLSDWYYFNGNNGGGTGTAASSLNLFDSFENDGADCITGALPAGGDACGFANPTSRWFFGPTYCNMFTVGSFSATSTTPGDRLELGWFWYCANGTGNEECFIGVFTGSPFDTGCNVNYTLGAGVVLGFGSIPCRTSGYYFTDVCLCDFGIALDMFTDGPPNEYAAIGGVLAKAFDQGTGELTLATCSQFMLWGADGGGGGNDLAGSHGNVSYDDDVTLDGVHTPDECYPTNIVTCPDPVHFMVGVGNCGGSACDAVVTKVIPKKGPPCTIVVVKGTDATFGDTFTVTLSDGDSKDATANDRGKWKAKFTGKNIANGGTITGSACGSEKTGTCN